jgi:hypothetical protein
MRRGDRSVYVKDAIGPSEADWETQSAADLLIDYAPPVQTWGRDSIRIVPGQDGWSVACARGPILSSPALPT